MGGGSEMTSNACGKSVAAALTIFNLQSSLGQIALGETDPAAALRIVDRQLYPSSLPGLARSARFTRNVETSGDRK